MSRELIRKGGTAEKVGLQCHWNYDKDGAVETSCNKAFEACTAATGKVRSPSIDCHVAGTTRAVVEAECSVVNWQRKMS